jgi:hypothetical protein
MIRPGICAGNYLRGRKNIQRGKKYRCKKKIDENGEGRKPITKNGFHCYKG